jgi:hypothetical protein
LASLASIIDSDVSTEDKEINDDPLLNTQIKKAKATASA